jgi:hypothetical protein
MKIIEENGKKLKRRDPGDVVGTWVIVCKYPVAFGDIVDFKYNVQCKICSKRRTVHRHMLEEIGRKRPACLWCNERKRRLRKYNR